MEIKDQRPEEQEGTKIRAHIVECQRIYFICEEDSCRRHSGSAGSIAGSQLQGLWFDIILHLMSV